MKPVLHFTVIGSDYSKALKRKILFITVSLFSLLYSFAQCPAGYTRDTLNWDYMDFFHRSGSNYGGTNPVTSQPYVTAAMAQTQYFNVSGNRITFTNTNSLPIGQNPSTVFYADITTHTGETGSFGRGEDVKFMPAASPATYSMTFTFQNAVQNLMFSVYDVDVDQRITVTALNGATPVNITMTRVTTAILTITGSGTTSANAKAANTPGSADNSADGTANVTIAGPLTSFTITVSETTIRLTGPGGNRDDGGFYLSDISACMANPSFPTNYYSPYTQPFTGQPAYFLANPQNLHVYMVDPATGTADYLFSDPGVTGDKMNSLAYDPVNHWLYYVMDNVVPPMGNLTLKKYDFETESISTVIADLPAFGIPCFQQGIEYGGAAFYNGSLYLGVEGSDGTTYGTGAESVIWKIDFDGSGNPTTYAQVFGYLGDNGGGSPSHDWGDLVIKDGMIITHGTGPNTSTNHYMHYNMQTGTAVYYTGSVAGSAGQMGQTWNGNVYQVKNYTALYNNDGTTGAQTSITVTSCSPAWSSNAGDASDPFKPKCDFGDAPATYDAVALSPAVHQWACNNSTLRIGSAWDREWSKFTSADASGDGADEDGITTVTVMVSDGVPYNHVQEVTVLNNTGADAYLGGWLDYNANGVFEASEGVIVTVPSNASPQLINLEWTGITVAIGTPDAFLRIRLVSNNNTLTASNATGWYSDGEVEDYPVISSAVPLLTRLLDFNAFITNSKQVQLNWKAVTDENADGFEIQRSRDKNNWETIGWLDKNNLGENQTYLYTDAEPFEGNIYYRLLMVEKSGSSRFSPVKSVYIDKLEGKISIAPNPVNSSATISIVENYNGTAIFRIRNVSGQVMYSRNLVIRSGENRFTVDVSNFPRGIYISELVSPEKIYTEKMIINK